MEKSWITTLVGCLAAAANTALPLLQSGSIDLQTLLVSVGLAVLGIFSKDYNVTGGSK